MSNQIAIEDENKSGLPAGYDVETKSLAVSLATAEIDQQITTAHAFPRSVTRAVSNIKTLATLDDESAQECIYALPRGGKPIKGPSIRLAEIISSQWGNCRVGARVVHVDRFEKYVEAEGVFHDLETNTATTARVRRRISGKNGQLLTEDMILVTSNAACSIAKRNAILGGVPKAVWRSAYAAVESVIVGDSLTLGVRREAAVKAFAAYGIVPDRVFAALDVQGVDDITLEHLSTLSGFRSALKNGEATEEEIFPKIDSKGAVALSAQKTIAGRLQELAKSTPQHDPETGEIGKGEAPEEAPQAAKEAPKQTKRPPAEATQASQLVPAEKPVQTVQEVDPPTEPEHPYDMGRAARDAGLTPRAMPKNFDDKSADAWRRGHADRDEELSSEAA